MNQARLSGPILILVLGTMSLLLPSCSTTDEFLKALKIDYVPEKEQKTEDQKTITGLQKELSALQKKEATLRAEVSSLEQEISDQDRAYNTQISELRNQLDQKKEAIDALTKELNDKEALISIQSKVIGLLDDADQTLQKSIEEQLQDRQ